MTPQHYKTACLAMFASLVMINGAVAQTFPNRPLRLVVPFSPGGAADVPGRILTQKMTEALGQQVIVDNRPGAGSTIGAESVAKAPPDGYSLLMISNTHFVSAALYKKLVYDSVADFAPVTQVTSAPNVIVVHPSLPAKSVKELIALAKAKPDMLNFGSSGNGAPSHLAGEMFKSSTGTRLVHVPYKGAGPAVNALLAGEIQVMFAPIVAVLPQVKAGRLRALGVTSAKRSAAAPDLPTLAEAGLTGYEISSWFGLFVPASTPNAVVDKLYKDTLRVLKSPDVLERFAKEGAESVGNSPADFNNYVRAEFVKYNKVIKDNGIKAD